MLFLLVFGFHFFREGGLCLFSEVTGFEFCYGYLVCVKGDLTSCAFERKRCIAYRWCSATLLDPFGRAQSVFGRSRAGVNDIETFVYKERNGK